MADVRPDKLSDIVGLTHAKEVLGIAIGSAKLRGDVLGHTIASGPSGTGKTTLAKACANELGTNCKTLIGAGIKEFKQLIPHLDNLERGDILFIDEIHRMPAKVYENLYTVLEDFEYHTTQYGTVPVKKFTLIGATTHIGKIPEPFRRRFKNVLELPEYNLDEMTEIVKRVAKLSDISLKGNTARQLAKTCRSNPSLAVRRTEALRDYMIQVVAKNSVSGQDADEIIKNVLRLQGVDQHGLTPNDHRYLSILKNEGSASLGTLCSKLNIEQVTVVNEIEPYLQRLGLITIERPIGRTLNKRGYKQLFGNT